MSNLKNDSLAKAFTLFKQGKNQKEIAAVVGVAEKTVGIWKLKYNWEQRRQAAQAGVDRKPFDKRLQELVREQQTLLARLTANAADMAATVAELAAIDARLAH